MPVPLTLKVYKGTPSSGPRSSSRDIIKIGRLSSAHLCLEDEKVSRIHSVIEVSPDGALSIIDMGSVEGPSSTASGEQGRAGLGRRVSALAASGWCSRFLQPQVFTPRRPGCSAALPSPRRWRFRARPRSPARPWPPQPRRSRPVPRRPARLRPLRMDQGPVPATVRDCGARRPRLSPAAAPHDAATAEGVEFRLFWDTTLSARPSGTAPPSSRSADTKRCAFQVPADKLPVRSSGGLPPRAIALS